MSHGINLEKAGATAVVPEILEPSLQLAAAVLGTLDFQQDEVSRMIDDFRRNNTRELQDLALTSKASIGYGKTPRHALLHILNQNYLLTSRKGNTSTHLHHFSGVRILSSTIIAACSCYDKS